MSNNVEPVIRANSAYYFVASESREAGVASPISIHIDADTIVRCRYNE